MRISTDIILCFFVFLFPCFFKLLALLLLKKEVIFEWDEDFVNGSHYHVMLPGDNGKHNGTHYYAGDPVPEPWNTLFFGG